ncbi:MAG: glycosyl hydrolase [Candidatus Jordarchaeaceae archaeon]
MFRRYKKIVYNTFLLIFLLVLSTASISFGFQSSNSIYSSGIISYPRVYKYGVCFHAWVDYNSHTKNILSNIGEIWIRSDWKLTTFMYSWKNEMKQMGNKILGIINYATLDWKNFNLTDWERTVRNVVTNAPDVPAWEIWNEPNAPNFKLGYMDGTPEHYFDMLKIAYNIIKNETEALVVGPATGPTSGWIDWLQRLFALGALDYLDVVSIHLYYDTVSDNQKFLTQIKSIVGNKPIWITEIGKPSAITRNEEFQKMYLETNFAPKTGLDADKLFWYELVDNPSLSDSTEGYFGLVRSDYTFKPSYYAFKSLID